MHTRRLAAFFLGAWILGSLLIDIFVAPQTVKQVERIMQAPPGPIAKDIEDLGSDITRQMLRYQAMQTNRSILETWGVVQVGIAAALLSAVLLTAHRSKTLILLSAVMMLLTLISTFVIVPALSALGRGFDFVPEAASSIERDTYQTYNVWMRVVEVLKLLLGFALSGRLLFDRMGWKDRFAPDTSSVRHGRRRRRKRTSDGSVVEPVNHPNDSHVDG